MAVAWYLRLFYVWLVSFGVSFLLFYIIQAKRMTSAGPGKLWAIIFWLVMIIGVVLMWFTTFRIAASFWIGAAILIFGQIMYALGYAAMREYPERKKKVVDWGIYGVSRHSHVLAGSVTLVGIVIMGWNPGSIVYFVLWAYVVAHIIIGHLAILAEEKINLRKFGKDYEEYMRTVPRYFWILN